MSSFASLTSVLRRSGLVSASRAAPAPAVECPSPVPRAELLAPVGDCSRAAVRSSTPADLLEYCPLPAVSGYLVRRVRFFLFRPDQPAWEFRDCRTRTPSWWSMTTFSCRPAAMKQRCYSTRSFESNWSVSRLSVQAAWLRSAGARPLESAALVALA